MQQNTSVMWAAIILLAALAGVFGVMSFNAQQTIQHLTDELHNSDIADIQRTYNNNKLADVIRRELALQDDLQKAYAEGAALKKAAEDANRRYDDAYAESVRLNSELVKERERRVTIEQTAANNLQQANERHQRAMQEQTNLIEVNNRTIARQERQIRELEETNRRWTEAHKTLNDNFANRTRDLVRSRDALIVKVAATTASRSGVTEAKKESDGKILAVDLLRKTVQISLGADDKIFPGMRFRVTRTRLGRPETIAEIEVTKVSPGTSEAAILERMVQRKMDPQTGEIFDDPNFVYNPYRARTEYNPETGDVQRAERGQEKAQELVALEQVEISSMNPLNPVMVEDDILNDLYNPDRVYRYVHVGDPLYASREKIFAEVRRHGGLITEDGKVDSTTDYLILSLIPDEQEFDPENETHRAKIAKIREMNEQVKLAREFGVQIIRESALFNMNAPR